MELPVRKLTDILSLRVFKENGKRPFQSHVCPEMLEGSLTKLISMVIVSDFELEWNTEKSIFRSEYGEEYMPHLHGGT